MQFDKLTALFVGLIALGAVVYAFSDRKRNMATGQTSTATQNAYLLMLVGAFCLTASNLSFTATLLLFTLASFLCWSFNIFMRVRAKKAGEDPKLAPPPATEYVGEFFWVLLLLFVLRTFLFEPFVIPSSSMRPNLVPGDFVLVNKYVYGIRMPIRNDVVIPIDKPRRGDVLVFQDPRNDKVNLIKRVVGVGGDRVSYLRKRLFINGVEAEDTPVSAEVFMTDSRGDSGSFPIPVTRYVERLDDKTFPVFKIDKLPSVDVSKVRNPFMGAQCFYPSDEEFECVVPEGMYFAMGDNRDYSEDSRYWGFFPDDHVIGKAVAIWMNANDFGRIGKKIQ